MNDWKPLRGGLMALVVTEGGAVSLRDHSASISVNLSRHTVIDLLDLLWRSRRYDDYLRQLADRIEPI